MEYLLKVQNVYRVATEQEALDLRERLRNETNGTLTAFAYNVKYVKAKGEIIGEYYVCKATIEFNTEREPERHVIASYEDM